MGELIGYARCSTVLQDLTAQREILASLGVPPGETRSREEGLRGRGQLRGWTATPRNLIRAMPGKGDHPAGGFFSARAAARPV